MPPTMVPILRMNSGMFFSSLNTGTTRLSSMAARRIGENSVEVDVHYAVGADPHVGCRQREALVGREHRVRVTGPGQGDPDPLGALQAKGPLLLGTAVLLHPEGDVPLGREADHLDNSLLEPLRGREVEFQALVDPSVGVRTADAEEVSRPVPSPREEISPAQVLEGDVLQGEGAHPPPRPHVEYV